MAKYSRKFDELFRIIWKDRKPYNKNYQKIQTSFCLQIEHFLWILICWPFDCVRWAQPPVLPRSDTLISPQLADFDSLPKSSWRRYWSWKVERTKWTISLFQMVEIIFSLFLNSFHYSNWSECIIWGGFSEAEGFQSFAA